MCTFQSLHYLYFETTIVTNIIVIITIIVAMVNFFTITNHFGIYPAVGTKPLNLDGLCLPDDVC